jgi:predicted phage terminase large subunit-like protein
MIDPGKLSIVDQLAIATPEEREAYVAGLDPAELELLVDQDWSVIARPDQLLPAELVFLWLVRGGRGAGKTRTGAEGTVEKLKELLGKMEPGQTLRWALMSQRDRDVVHTMVEGESGLRQCLPPSWLPLRGWDQAFNKSALILTLRDVVIQGFSARTPDAPRGPQFHGGWVDEPAAFPDAHLGLDEDTAMSNLMLGMRLQPFGCLIVTGTPKNNRLIKELRKMDGVRETIMPTKDNLHNLADVFRRVVVARYAGTRLGRQELDAEILEGLGTVFHVGWFQAIERNRYPWPDGTPTVAVRYWDLASGEETDANPDPDWTAGALVRKDPRRRWYVIEHIDRFRLGPGSREQRMRKRAQLDGLPITWIEKEPGNAGTSQHHWIGAELDDIGVTVRANPVSGPKHVRWEALAGPAEQRRVWVWDDDEWLRDFLDEAEEAHPDPKQSGPHDDMLDAVAGAIQMLRSGGAMASVAGPPATPIPRPNQRRQGGSNGSIPRPGQRGGLSRRGR